MPPSSAARTRLGLSAFITPMLTIGTSMPVRPSTRRGGPAVLATGAAGSAVGAGLGGAAVSADKFCFS